MSRYGDKPPDEYIGDITREGRYGEKIPDEGKVMTGDEIINAINGGTLAITRANALSSDDLKIVVSIPTEGKQRVTNIYRNPDDNRLTVVHKV